ncbi:hypothetical protein TNCV_132521 [Trichonephila clavipes]|nr:hypothetical protein TNCV_132521 [Trichonephila clavipes]
MNNLAILIARLESHQNYMGHAGSLNWYIQFSIGTYFSHLGTAVKAAGLNISSGNSDDLLSQCHVELLHFTTQRKVSDNIRRHPSGDARPELNVGKTHFARPSGGVRREFIK